MSNPIVRYVQKQLFGQKGMIANNKAVNFEAAKLAEKLSEFGVDPRFIQTEKQVQNIINQIKAFEKKRLSESMEVISQDDPRFKGIMSKMMGSNVIKRDFGKPFKEEIKKMESEADIAKRIAEENEKGLANIRKKQKMLADAIDDASPGFANDIKVDAELVAENLAQRMGLVYDDLPTKQRLDIYDEAYTGLSKQRFKNMKKPIAEGLSDKEFKNEKISFRLNIARNSPEFNQDLSKKIINKEIYTDLSDVQRKELLKDLDFVLKNPRDGNADGGRIGFKMGRRAFLKALGAGIGGAAALKTGMIGLGGKKAVTGAGEKIITAPVKGKPEWFDALVNKVIREGDDVTKDFATKERMRVHKLDIDNLDDVRVTQDLDEGVVRVEYNSPNNMGEDSVELVFKSGRNQMDETTGKVADEFYAVEKEPRGIRTGPDDYDIEFDGENFVRSVDDLQSDTSKLKEVATGKKQTLSEFVNSKKKKDKVKQINEDQVEQAEYLEQKYGPGPEDADDFASGGLAGMLGQ